MGLPDWVPASPAAAGREGVQYSSTRPWFAPADGNSDHFQSDQTLIMNFHLLYVFSSSLFPHVCKTTPVPSYENLHLLYVFSSSIFPWAYLQNNLLSPQWNATAWLCWLYASLCGVDTHTRALVWFLCVYLWNFSSSAAVTRAASFMPYFNISNIKKHLSASQYLYIISFPQRNSQLCFFNVSHQGKLLLPKPAIFFSLSRIAASNIRLQLSPK